MPARRRARARRSRRRRRAWSSASTSPRRPSAALDPRRRASSGSPPRACGASRRRRCSPSRARARALLTGERTALNFLAAPERRRDADRALRPTRSRARARGSSTRARPRPACARSRRPRSSPAAATNHRVGLYDMVLIKENHVAAAGGVGARPCAAARERCPGPAARGRVPRRSTRSTRRWRPARTRILLDNMTPDELRAAVAARRRPRGARGQRRHRPREPSGTSPRPGVDFVSVGALTHSAPALDLSLLLEPLP